MSQKCQQACLQASAALSSLAVAAAQEVVVRFLMAILGPWSAICVLVAVSVLRDPAGVCGDPSGIGMCCISCAVFGYLFMVPVFGFLFAALLFVPGFLIVAFVARRIGKWRPVYWIFGWMFTGMSAVILISMLVVIRDGNFIAVSEKGYELGIFTIASGIFGLLCGICYWAMLIRASRSPELRR
jgi:hypothetical protein